MTREWRHVLPDPDHPPPDRRIGERRSPWPTVIYSKHERRRHPDRRKIPR